MSRRWLLLWPLALLLAACSSPAARARHADQVWAALETPACDLPCWQGITPGQSTLPEVESTLRSLDLVAGVECFEVPDAGETPGTRSGGFCTWESRAGYPLWGGVFQFEQPGNEVLRQNFLYLRRPVSFEAAVSHFGQPESAWAIELSGAGGTCACTDRNPQRPAEGDLDAELLYPSRGLMLVAQKESSGQWPCLCAAMWVDAIALNPPAAAATLDDWWRLLFGYGLDEEGGVFFEFEGFGVAFR